MTPKIRHMWECPRPDPHRKGAGFPVLENARHSLIFAGEREAGAYNHHSQLTWHGGQFHAIWSNHPHGEDGPGQRVRCATSTSGEDWTSARILFPAPDTIRPSEEMGLALTAFCWVNIGDRLFAVVGCHANIGFCDFDRTSFSAVRDADHPCRARKGYSPLTREILPDGDAGPVFAIWEDVPQDIDFGVLSPGNPDIAAEVRGLRAVLTSPLGMCAWDFRGDLSFPEAADGHRLCEPTVHRAPDGRYVMLLRDTAYSHRMYVSFSETGEDWSAGVPTDIPDSPSLSDTVMLDDGKVLLVGNQMAPAFDNPDEIKHYARDPLTVAVSPDGYTFTRVYALRCGQQQYRVPQSEIHGRGGGAQYPCAITHEDNLYVQYSMGKEDICVSWVPLGDILD